MSFFIVKMIGGIIQTFGMDLKGWHWTWRLYLEFLNLAWAEVTCERTHVLHHFLVRVGVAILLLLATWLSTIKPFAWFHVSQVILELIVEAVLAAKTARIWALSANFRFLTKIISTIFLALNPLTPMTLPIVIVVSAVETGKTVYFCSWAIIVQNKNHQARKREQCSPLAHCVICTRRSWPCFALQSMIFMKRRREGLRQNGNHQRIKTSVSSQQFFCPWRNSLFWKNDAHFVTIIW